MSEPAVYRPAIEGAPEGVPRVARRVVHSVAVVLAVVLQLLGLVAIVVGAFLLAAWLGWGVLGAVLFVVGLFGERVIARNGSEDAGTPS